MPSTEFRSSRHDVGVVHGGTENAASPVHLVGRERAKTHGRGVPVCVIDRLRKRYRAGFEFGPVTLEVPAGQIVGLLGRNGAGKTTLIRLTLGLLRKDSGTIRLFGSDTDAASARVCRQETGYLDEEPVLYDWMKVSWIARFISRFYPTWEDDLFRDYLSRFEISFRQRVGELSRGNKVKLGVALALAHRPRFVLMDEPTSGLDPLVRREILGLLEEYVSQDHAPGILFSSHITSDLELVCDRVAILDAGRLALDLPVAGRKNRAPGGSPRERRPTLEQAFLDTIRDGAN